MNDLLSETLTLKIHKVFKCKKDNTFLGRKNVWKDKDGKYHCNNCHEVVEDVTNTQTGNYVLETVRM